MKSFINLIVVFIINILVLGSAPVNDYIIYRGELYISSNERPSIGITEGVERYANGELFKCGDLGTVTNIKDAVNLDAVASVLPSGTGIYSYFLSDDVILAEADNLVTLYIADKDEIGIKIGSAFIDSAYTDYVFFDNAVYINAENEPSQPTIDTDYVKGAFFGEILYQSDERNLHKIKSNTANILSVGTRFYLYDDNPQIILADTESGLIPYMKLLFD
jgi:hypothetical protein